MPVMIIFLNFVEISKKIVTFPHAFSDAFFSSSRAKLITFLKFDFAEY